MSDIINVQKLSIIRRYPTELIVLGLITWCTYLQLQLTTINKEKEVYIMQDRNEVLKAIQETNRVIDKNNILFENLIMKNVQPNNTSYEFRNYTGKGESKNG